MNLKTEISQQSSEIFKFTAFTDGLQIQFFFCSDHKFYENNFIASPVLELFPVDHNAEVVPQGFVYLCQLLTLMSESLFPKFFIQIGQEMATIKKVYQLMFIWKPILDSIDEHFSSTFLLQAVKNFT